MRFHEQRTPAHAIDDADSLPCLVGIVCRVGAEECNVGITQGTRGKKGRDWSARIWTAISTCESQGRPIFQFLCDAVEAHFKGLDPPLLTPAVG